MSVWWLPPERITLDLYISRLVISLLSRHIVIVSDFWRVVKRLKDTHQSVFLLCFIDAIHLGLQP